MKRHALLAAVLSFAVVLVGWIAPASSQPQRQRSDESIQEWQKNSLRPPQGGKVEPGPFPEPMQSDQDARRAFTNESWNTFSDLDRKITALGKKMEAQGAEVKAEATKAWDDLKTRQAAARTGLDKLSSASDEGWEGAKSDATAALNGLKSAYNKAASYFR